MQYIRLTTLTPRISPSGDKHGPNYFHIIRIAVWWDYILASINMWDLIHILVNKIMAQKTINKLETFGNLNNAAAFWLALSS